MQASIQTAPNSTALVWTGRVISILVVLFMLFDAVMKFIKPPFVVEGTIKYGYPESTIVGMGAALLISTLLYMVPRTSALGAILLTGYLGGAVATHVRASDSTFSIIFPVVFGALAWGGLYLRDPRVRALIPLRS
jgi:hypothetical protein